MGCSNSSEITLPNSPLEEFEYQEKYRERLQRKLEKEQKQIEKLRKKISKKQKRKLKRIGKSTRKSDASQCSYLNDDNENDILSLENLESQLEEETKELLNNDLCTFLLNQTVYSTEFFGNYERELTSTLAEILDRENELNKNLDDKSILLASPLDVAIKKWVKYKPVHGVNKSQPQLLQNPVVYVVFDNIEISRIDDSNYDTISPHCKVIIETKSYRSTPCKEEFMEMLREIRWKGYVRLKLPDEFKVKNNKSSLSEKGIYCGGSQSKGKSSIYGSNLISMGSSGYCTEGDYDYAYISKLNARLPLSHLKLAERSDTLSPDTKVLPDWCISYLGDYLDARLMDDSDDDLFDLNKDGQSKFDIDLEKNVKNVRNVETLQAIKRYKSEVDRRRKLLHQKYLNSQNFMRNFGETMHQKLGTTLLREKTELETATYRGASIYTKDLEIIPAIHVAQNAQFWPECIAHFRLRERPIIKHPCTGEKVQWPTRAMLKQIETFGYHVIPLGYAPKRRKNPFRELEWRIVLPKAERYLERHLSYSQAKILMIMKTLVKTFIEPKCKSLMFAMDLLRTHLFWECERNSTNWPDEFLGDVLLRFIDTFKACIKQKRLRDYFIQERNLLENIPESSLMTLVSILSDIQSNPLMHLLVAYRNLEFNEKFFPKLDYKKLYKNLCTDKLFKLRKLSKNSNVFDDSDLEDDEIELSVDFDEGPTGLIRLSESGDQNPGQFSKRACQLLYEIEKSKQKEKQRQGSMDSINVEFYFSKNVPEYNEYGLTILDDGLEILRRTNLLEILLDHFLGCLRKSLRFRNVVLAKQWFVQVKRFLNYYKNYGCDLLAKDYEDLIEIIEDVLTDSRNSAESCCSTETEESEFKQATQGSIEDGNSYEEVFSPSENIYALQSAMKTREATLRDKIRKLSDNSQYSTLSKNNNKNVVVEIHSTKSAGTVNTGEEMFYIVRKSSNQSKKPNKNSDMDQLSVSRIFEIFDNNVFEEKTSKNKESCSNTNETFCETVQIKSKRQVKTSGKRTRKIKTSLEDIHQNPKSRLNTNENQMSHLSKQTPENSDTTEDLSSETNSEVENVATTSAKCVSKLKNLKKVDKFIKKESSRQIADSCRESNNGRENLAFSKDSKSKNNESDSECSDNQTCSSKSDLSSRSSNRKKQKPAKEKVLHGQVTINDVQSKKQKKLKKNLKIKTKKIPEIVTADSSDNESSYGSVHAKCYNSNTIPKATNLFDIKSSNSEFKCLDNISLMSIKTCYSSEEEKTVAKKNNFTDNNELFKFNVVNEKHSKNSFKESCSSTGDSLEEIKTSSSKIKYLKNENNTNVDIVSDGENCDETNTQETRGCESREQKEIDEDELVVTEKLKQNSLITKYINRENVLKNFPIISSEMIDTLKESKERIKSSVSEEKISKMRNILLTKSMILKNAILKQEKCN